MLSHWVSTQDNPLSRSGSKFMALSVSIKTQRRKKVRVVAACAVVVERNPNAEFASFHLRTNTAHAGFITLEREARALMYFPLFAEPSAWLFSLRARNEAKEVFVCYFSKLAAFALYSPARCSNKSFSFNNIFCWFINQLSTHTPTEGKKPDTLWDNKSCNILLQPHIRDAVSLVLLHYHKEDLFLASAAKERGGGGEPWPGQAHRLIHKIIFRVYAHTAHMQSFDFLLPPSEHKTHRNPWWHRCFYIFITQHDSRYANKAITA